jgi:hypothetical protein
LNGIDTRGAARWQQTGKQRRCTEKQNSRGEHKRIVR